MKSGNARKEIFDEMLNARNKFPVFNSAHEGYAVILEELDELWEAVKLNQNDPRRIEKMRIEAIQVGAMALRFLVDCIPDRKYGGQEE